MRWMVLRELRSGHTSTQTPPSIPCVLRLGCHRIAGGGHVASKAFHRFAGRGGEEGGEEEEGEDEAHLETPGLARTVRGWGEVSGGLGASC